MGCVVKGFQRVLEVSGSKVAMDHAITQRGPCILPLWNYAPGPNSRKAVYMDPLGNRAAKGPSFEPARHLYCVDFGQQTTMGKQL